MYAAFRELGNTAGGDFTLLIDELDKPTPDSITWAASNTSAADVGIEDVPYAQRDPNAHARFHAPAPPTHRMRRCLHAQASPRL